jgi:hypothetical protein
MVDGLYTGSWAVMTPEVPSVTIQDLCDPMPKSASRLQAGHYVEELPPRFRFFSSPGIFGSPSTSFLFPFSSLFVSDSALFDSSGAHLIDRT